MLYQNKYKNQQLPKSQIISNKLFLIDNKIKMKKVKLVVINNNKKVKKVRKVKVMNKIAQIIHH